jgi:hypothetical protein
MEGEISNILLDIREKSHNIGARHTKHTFCQLKSVYTEMLELRSEGDSNDRQVCMAYSNLFNEQYFTDAACGKRILVQGEAAVGKTTLCTSIIEDWASGMHFQEFQLVLLLPLSLRDMTSASSLSGLLSVVYTDFNQDTCSIVAEYLKMNRKHNILLIADGWEELHDSQRQAGSFLHSLLFSSDIIPTSSTTVLITSRPGCIEMNIVQLIDKIITLTGFDKNAIESIVHSEFAGDLKRICYLTAQMNDNPLVACVCGTPLNLAIACHLCRASDAGPLPDTMTKLYSKLIWTLASASIGSGDSHESSMSSHHASTSSFSSHHDLPEELQQSWWQVCELAFSNVHSTFSSSDYTALTSSKLQEISYLGLAKPITEIGDTLSHPFVHPRFEEYLAALHLAKQPKETQLKFMRDVVANEECKSKMAIIFWHFFMSNGAHQVYSQLES